MTVVELAVDDLTATIDAYRRLLARDDSADEYATSNATLRFDRSQLGHRVLFDVADASSWQTLLERRGLDAHHRETATIHVDGLPVGVTEYRKPRPHATLSAGDISGIDHLVFQAAGRDHAVALFGSTLGLDFRLDRHVDEGLRQLFFRADDLIVEVLVTPNGLETTGRNLLAPPIALWGIAWATTDIEASQTRLASAGFTVSQVRTGRKPDTRVATVRSPALATRTLIIEPARSVTAKETS
ncbi:VOC family protein [Gordonia sputi]|nr:hypothetical protein A5777_04985 [Gordonia sp. 852002-10350_SCH5691597]